MHISQNIKKIIILVILLTLAVLIFKFNKKTTQDIVSIKSDQKIETTVAEINKNENSNNDDLKNNVNFSDLKMPILMYHHIRNYDDNNDPIGTNLTVSPEKFAGQLDLMIEKGYKTITLNDLEKGNLPEKPIILTFDDGYQNFYDYAYPEIIKRDMKAVVFVIVNKIDEEGYLTKEEISDLINHGIEIGSHTLSHPNLTTIEEIKAEEEIIKSKQELETMFGVKIASFCYPAGFYNDNIKNIVEGSEYRFAVTTKNSLADFTNQYLLNRYRMSKDVYISGYLK